MKYFVLDQQKETPRLTPNPPYCLPVSKFFRCELLGSMENTQGFSTTNDKMQIKPRHCDFERHRTVEESLKVDIHQIRRAMRQSKTAVCRLTWEVGRVGISGVAVLIENKLLVLLDNQTFSAYIVYRKPHFGGISASLACPSCARGVRTLFADDKRMACRQCCGLRYQSQLERAPDRSRRRATKICKRIDPSHISPMSVPKRRKGQWRRSYLRLLSNLAQVHNTSHSVYRAELEQLKHKEGEAR